jgi:cobalt/nickel transport system permease protein
LRQATFAQWSNRSSPVHRFDARLKLLLLIAFVISIALLRSFSGTQLGLAGAALVITAGMGKLPVWRLLGMSLLVLPFVGLFSVIVYLSGDARRAAFILVKSYLSALAVVVTVSSTPLPQLLAGARWFRLPALLVDVTQLIYRYLFVLSGEAQAMRTAFLARGGHPGKRALQASSGMVAVLFSRSYEKAVAIHNAMSARGFSGGLGIPEFRSFTAVEILVSLGGLVFMATLHFL